MTEFVPSFLTVLLLANRKSGDTVQQWHLCYTSWHTVSRGTLQLSAFIISMIHPKIGMYIIGWCPISEFLQLLLGNYNYYNQKH